MFKMCLQKCAMKEWLTIAVHYEVENVGDKIDCEDSWDIETVLASEAEVDSPRACMALKVLSHLKVHQRPDLCVQGIKSNFVLSLLENECYLQPFS